MYIKIDELRPLLRQIREGRGMTRPEFYGGIITNPGRVGWDIEELKGSLTAENLQRLCAKHGITITLVSEFSPVGQRTTAHIDNPDDELLNAIADLVSAFKDRGDDFMGIHREGLERLLKRHGRGI